MMNGKEKDIVCIEFWVWGHSEIFPKLMVTASSLDLISAYVRFHGTIILSDSGGSLSSSGGDLVRR